MYLIVYVKMFYADKYTLSYSVPLFSWPFCSMSLVDVNYDAVQSHVTETYSRLIKP